MSFTRPTLTTINTRVETDITSRLTGGAALLRIMFLKILAKAIAAVSHTLHGNIQNVSQMLFVRTAIGEFLESKAFERGLTRTPAVKATGQIQFTGTNGSNIPLGTIVQDANGQAFTTDTGVSISGGVATVNATCSVPGINGNIPVSSSMSVLSPLTGVNSGVISYSAFTGGSDIESDDSLKKRLLLVIQTPGNGGNKTDYQDWSLEIAGVAKSFIFPAYSGPGTVGVVITALGADPAPSSGLIASVQSNINTKAPVTAAATVFGITKINFRIGVSIPTAQNTPSIQSAIKSSLASLLSAEAAPGGTLLLTHIQDAILNSGVTNYIITSLYAGGSVAIADITVAGFGYLVPDETNYSFAGF